MIHGRPVFHLARLVVESRTPLSIGFGRGDGVFDTQLVRDANDLPAIPGSSFAGVLRHLFRRRYGGEATAALFGKAGREEGHGASFVHVSWGAIHDCRDRPVEGLLTPEAIDADPLLRDAHGDPLLRSHVRITHRGTAADGGQFDRTSLRAGHRFTVELSLWSERREEALWRSLPALVADPRFRLGGATRRGLGALRVVRGHHGIFDLSDKEGFAAYRRLSAELGATQGLTPLDGLAAAAEPALAAATLRLRPLDLFRLGQGCEPVGSYRRHAKDRDPDLLPLTERRVVWGKGGGAVDPNRYALLPASAVKGALSHRVACHYNALTGRFADDLPAAEVEGYDKAGNDAVRALFGEGKGEGSGRAGRVVIDDLYLPLAQLQPVRMMHNGIDRFTGGVRDHILFSEELLSGGELALELRVLPPQDPEGPGLSGEMVEALRRALTDLAEGRLGIGGGGARGHGFFEGEVAWSGALWNGGER